MATNIRRGSIALALLMCATISHAATLTLGVTVSNNLSMPITNNPAYKLIFDDEFSGSALNTGKWFAPVNQSGQLILGL